MNSKQFTILESCSRQFCDCRVINYDYRMFISLATEAREVCDAVGRAVASNTRDPRFESGHRQKSFTIKCIVSYFEKTKVEKKRPGMAQF